MYSYLCQGYLSKSERNNVTGVRTFILQSSSQALELFHNDDLPATYGLEEIDSAIKVKIILIKSLSTTIFVWSTLFLTYCSIHFLSGIASCKIFVIWSKHQHFLKFTCNYTDDDLEYGRYFCHSLYNVDSNRTYS